MVRLPAVLSLLREADSRPSGPDWDIIARDLRRGHQLSEGKRGLGAAPVTLQDAANLLIAGMATSSPSRGPEVVELYRGMRLVHQSGQLPRALENVAQEAEFGSALEELIHTSQSLQDGGWRLKLQVRSPVPEAHLFIFQRGVGGELVEFGRLNWARGSFPIEPLTGDLQVTTQALMTDRTIIELSRALSL